MGDPNSLSQLQNYVVGLSGVGVALTSEGSLDLERTFRRVNYFSLLSNVRVRNLVQRDLGVAPIDFVAMRVPRDALTSSLDPADAPDSDAVFLYGDDQHQALLLPRLRDGALWLRYLPVRDLVQDRTGAIHFDTAPWTDGFPLHLSEDPDLRVSTDRTSWLNLWHAEREWFDAMHRTRYSNGMIGLHEMFQRWQPESLPRAISSRRPTGLAGVAPLCRSDGGSSPIPIC